MSESFYFVLSFNLATHSASSFFANSRFTLFSVCLGYDPALVNPFLPKVLENLGAVVYDEIDNEGQTCFSINSVVSSYGEQLTLKQVKS